MLINRMPKPNIHIGTPNIVVSVVALIVIMSTMIPSDENVSPTACAPAVVSVLNPVRGSITDGVFIVASVEFANVCENCVV